MANNIANKLIVNAKSQEEIEQFLLDIQGEENGQILHIDFERIIPMPEELAGTSCDTLSSDCLYYFLMKTNKEGLVDKVFRYSSLKSMDRFNDCSEEKLAEYMERGEQIYKTYLKYGVTNWYDWRIYNWDTKWNAYETYIESCEGGSVEMYFYTAWSSPTPIIQKLVEMFPNLEFFYAYADEDTSYNCGKGYGKDGHISIDRAEDASDESMEIYIECWQEDWDNFKKTENGWVYDWGEDEE